MSHVSADAAGGALLLRWGIPLAIGLIGVAYQTHIGAGFDAHPEARLEHIVDLLLFGVVNPALAYWGWRVVARAREAAHLLAAIDIAAPDAIIHLGQDGRVGFWSRQAEVLLGFSATQANGRALWDLLGPDSEPLWLQLRDMLRRSGLVRGHKAVCRGRDGTEMRVELCASPVVDDAGHSRGMLVVLRSLSDRSKPGKVIAQLDRGLAEKARQLAQANAALQEANRSHADLLSLALHEVRAPLAGIAGAAESMESSCANPTPSCTRMLGVVRGQVSRLNAFAGQVLKTAQIEAGALMLEREPTSVAAIVQPVVEHFQAGNPARQLRIAVSPELPAVYADRDCMAQVLCNLLGNADKYSPFDGMIEVEAREEGRQVRVSVRDHGPGLGAEALEHAFDKFYRARTPETRAACGHGLGLYICRQIVLGHGGEIRAENHPCGRRGVLLQHSGAVMSDSRGSVLIIDDDPVLRELLSDQLRSAGYDALSEPDGAAGLRAAARSSPDMVVLDVMMPGLSGWDVCERLRAASPVPILMLTARDDEIDKLRAFRLGADDYVTVPCSFAEVVARIGAVLARCRHAVTADQAFRSGSLVVDLDRRQITVDGQAVDLTALEFRIVAALTRQSPRPVELDTLVSAAWGEAAEGGSEQIKHHIWALRQKLEADPGNPRHLITVRGVGYRLQ